MQKAAKYLGHNIDTDGLRATPENIAVIVNAPKFAAATCMGLLNYYRKFLPNLVPITNSLNDLLQKDKQWVIRQCRFKELLTTYNLLMHYNNNLPLPLAADTSQYGLGAVILHVLPTEKSIVFT